MGEQVGGLIDRHAGLAGAGDLRFGGDAVAEREQDPRLHDPRGAIVAVGLQRVQELDPRGADVAGLPGGDAPLVGRARAARAGGEGEKERAVKPRHPGQSRDP